MFAGAMGVSWKLEVHGKLGTGGMGCRGNEKWRNGKRGAGQLGAGHNDNLGARGNRVKGKIGMNGKIG